MTVYCSAILEWLKSWESPVASESVGTSKFKSDGNRSMAEQIIVIDDPRAFLEVDEASVVIALAPDIPARQIIADLTRPAILLWDNVVNSDTNQFWQVTLNSSTLCYTLSLSIRIYLIPPLAPTLSRHV